MLMGFLLFFNSKKMRLSDLKTDSEFSKGLVIGGMIFSALSPGFIIWWATIGVSTLAKAASFGIAGIFMLIIGHWIADVAWYGTLSLTVHHGKSYLTDVAYQNILKFFSFLLTLVGLSFLANGV